MARTLSREEAIKAAENAAPCDNPFPEHPLTDEDYRAIARAQIYRVVEIPDHGDAVYTIGWPGAQHPGRWEYRGPVQEKVDALNGRAAVAEYERRKR